ncbi:cytochrome P450 [Arthrobacter sp. zg-Y1143]|uniref:cytochrome P450 n=1 Tax=Arthrobacter sp. zg-Y1143 TaxID=3049065 RepID=UPI0024C2F9F3|nr:cytochrome P450 [Arthrobacter sp. zg-Y1143]MDK1326551.1 cytochrome P450 [Arthrobacter sp. zg-Y1143]
MIPKLPSPDSSLAFLREGYTFISSRCDRLGTDLFRTRIAGRPVYCMRGAEAAQIFYDGDRFSRKGALPPTVVHLLQDKGSVQTLDGAAHHHRKAMFTAMMAPESIARIGSIFEDVWRRRTAGWSGKPVVLHEEARWMLTAAACEWAGIPQPDAVVDRRAAEFGLMVDQAGSFGPANWWAQLRRRSTERWAQGIVSAIRSGALEVSPTSAAGLVAGHRDPEGQLLPVDIAAVELLNVLRPIVAVARFITFAGTALVEHPQWRQQFAGGSDDDRADLEPFAQEVRRFYPFFPAIAGTVLKDFSWNGHDFRPGSWVMLDIYGTNHDSRLWPDPEAFRPERFRTWDDNPYRLVPQGAGQVSKAHRCPGEGLTLELVKTAVRLLAEGGYGVPAQDLSISLSQLPSIPRSGLLLTAAGPAGRGTV